MIGGNGSYVEEHNQVIMHQMITMEQCKSIVNWLHERGLEFYLECNNGLFASEKFEQRADSTIKEYTKRKGNKDSEQMTVRKIFPEMIFNGELYRDDLNKVSYVLDSYQDFLDTKEKFTDLESGTWGGKDEEALFGDLGVKGITKAKAIEHLLDYLKADRADTIAFGDAKVDIPMLEYCAYGVAMGSGGKEIKEMADYVTDDVDKDGLYKAFLQLNLI